MSPQCRNERTATRRATAVARAGWLLFLIGLPFSIAGSQIALTLCSAAAVLALVFGRRRPPPLPLAWPVSLFIAISLLAIFASEDPTRSLRDLRGLILLIALYLPVVLVQETEDLERSLALACAAGALLAAIGLGQYLAGPGGVEGRLTGFHHWLTTAGQLMILSLLGFSRLLFGGGARRWVWGGGLLLICAALAFGFARSAWLGTAAGVGCLLLRRRSRLAWALAVLALVAVLMVPALRHRLLGLGNVDDPSVRNRLALLVSGAEMVRDHPLLGVGPNLASRIYPRYRRDWAPEPGAPHLHNDPLMVAAERGLLGLAAWLLWMGAACRSCWRAARSGIEPHWCMEGALAALIGFLVAGLFEYNFGDSEILMLVFPIMALPDVAARTRKERGQAPNLEPPGS